MATTLDDSDILRVVNRGDKTIRVMYDSKETRLDPGVDNFLPFACVALWFGDPRSADSIGSIVNERGLRTFVPDRETEVRRLRVKYDNQLGDETVIVNHPLVDVYTLQGDQIKTVLDDPRGESVIPATTTIADNSNLMAIVQRQQAAIDLLTQMVTQQQDAQQVSEEEQQTQTEPAQPPAPPEPPAPAPEATTATPPPATLPPSTPQPAPEQPATPPPSTTQQTIDMTNVGGTGGGGSTPLILPSTPQTGDTQPPADQG